MLNISSEGGSLNQKISIRRERLYEQVAEQLQELILSGELQLGDKLPPERKLAEQLGVSRIVVREAIKALEQKGLVHVMTGSGTYVSEMDPQITADSIGLMVRRYGSSFEHLNEVRRMLEIEIAGLAAERAKPEDIEALEKELQEMETSTAELQDYPNRVEDFVEADLRFHNALAQATHNPLIALLLEPISGLLLELRRVLSSTPDAQREGVIYHRRILEQIKAQDVVASRKAMQEHLARAQELASQGSA